VYFAAYLSCNMKRLLLFGSIITLLAGCGAKEKIGENILVNAMTDGRWGITIFTVNGGPNLFLDFAGYRFKYYSNKTVDVTRNDSLKHTGTWDADVNTKTTWASIPTATFPLSQVNGTWLITKNSWSYVEATQTVGADVRFMRLDKE
jgi:hypothetical protein